MNLGQGAGFEHAPDQQRAGRTHWLAWPAAWALRLLARTWRVRSEGSDPLIDGSGPAVAGIWHRDFLLAAAIFRDRGFSTPVSRSRDGDLIAAVLRHLGYAAPPRGSSSSGGAVALRGLVRLVEAGCSVAVPTDGPRGPARRAKIGIISVARLTGVAVTPVSFSAKPCYRFGSWDGSLLPLPFARVRCRYGESLAVPADSTPDQEQALCHRLESGMNATTDALDASTGLREER